MQQDDINDANRYIAVIRHQPNLDHLRSFNNKDETDNMLTKQFPVFLMNGEKERIKRQMLSHSSSFPLELQWIKII